MVYNAFDMNGFITALEKVVTVVREGQAYALDGIAPAVVITPTTPEEVSAALKLCSEGGYAGVVWGGGTHVHIGNPPVRYQWAMDMCGLARLVDYSPDDFVVTVEAGMRLQTLQEILLPYRQWFPNDSPLPHQQTIGGIVASGGAGSRRHRYGLPREWVLAVQAINAQGERFKAGVGVVKNVAGYDLPRLLSGSWGTLAVLTRLTLKLAPVPEVSVVYRARLNGASSLAGLGEQLNHPLLQLEMVDVLRTAERGWLLLIGIAGFEEDVEWVYDLLRRQTQLDYEVVSVAEQNLLRDWYLQEAMSVRCRCVLPPKEVYGLLAWLGEHGRECSIHAHVGSGIVRVWWAEQVVEGDTVRALREQVSRMGGFCVLEWAPLWLKQQVGVWGREEPSWNVMRRLKQEFDPAGILAPGRFLEQ